LQVPDELLGRMVKCPACGNTFAATASVAPGAAPAAPPAPPPVPPAGPPPRRASAEQAPTEDFEEARPPRRRSADDDAYEERPPRRRGADDWDDQDRERLPRRPPGDDYDDVEAPRGRGLGLQGLSSDYSIDFGVWFNHAKDHYSAVLGPLIGFLMIMFAIGFVSGFIQIIPIIGPILYLGVVGFVNPALNAGYVIVPLAQLKGRRWSFADFFSGFNWYASLLGNFWLTVAIMLVCMLPALITAGIVAVLVATTRNSDLFLIAIIVAVINYLAAIYVLLRTTCFGVQLIVDRDCGAVEAIKGSWMLSAGHFWGLLGVALLLGLMMLGGALACGIGMLFVAPLVVMSWNAGYLIITGNEPPRRSQGRDDQGYYEDRPERRD
jgi:hypothetical protein